MAIYHLSVKPVSRADGRSATAAAAYRAGVRITDERTGEIHDYTRKGGVEFSGIVAPFGVKGAYDREALWNAVEAAEKRKDARVAREFEIALPEELPAHERRRLAVEFARELVDRYGVAADVAVHAPSRDGDNRNHHAHILCTTREVKRGENGELVMGEKTALELSNDKRKGLGLPPSSEEITELRALWAQVANRSLEHHTNQRVDHRSLKDQGITDRLPQVHLGPAVTQMHRRGVKSDKWLSWEQANEALQAAAEGRRLAREQEQVADAVIDTKADLSGVLREQKRIEDDVARSSDAVLQVLPDGISARLDNLLDSVYYEGGDVISLYDDEVRDELQDIMSQMSHTERRYLGSALIKRDQDASKLQTWESMDEARWLASAPHSEWNEAYSSAREAYNKRQPVVAAPAARVGGGQREAESRPTPTILAPTPSEQAFVELRKRFPDAEWKPATDPQAIRGCVLKGALMIRYERHNIFESLDGKALVMCSPRPHLGLSVRVDGEASSAQEFVAGIVRRRAGQGLTTRVNGVEADGRSR